MTAQWHNGEPTDYGIEQFTCGDCWILGWTLHRRGGWPIIQLREPDVTDRWFHVMVRLEPFVYFDVNGIQDRSDVSRQWGSFRSARAHWLEGPGRPNEDESLYLHPIRRAYRMADRLIEKYELLKEYPCPSQMI